MAQPRDTPPYNAGLFAPSELDAAVEAQQRAYRDALLDRAALGLWRRTAAHSADASCCAGSGWHCSPPWPSWSARLSTVHSSESVLAPADVG